MDTIARLRPAAQPNYESASEPYGAGKRATERTGEQAVYRSQEGHYGKPTLSVNEYMAELNGRLRRHPMYLAGMHFPNPQPGSTPMLAAALAWEGPWDCLDVFIEVLGDVARDYDVVG
jgi:hypothetical protein